MIAESVSISKALVAEVFGSASGALVTLALLSACGLAPAGNSRHSSVSDLIVPGGLTLAELGGDHFLLDEHVDLTTAALAISVIRWLEKDDVY